MIGIGRERVDARLFKLPEVWGTAIGYKISGGIISDEICLTVFVSRKRRKSSLLEENLVPKQITIAGERYSTDVIQMGRSEEIQSINIPNRAHTIADLNTRSTLTGYARRGSSFFAMSCAHSMTGPDGDPHNPQRIEVRNVISEKWTRLGVNISAIYGKGTGELKNYGFSDAAIVKIEHPAAKSLVQSLARKNPLEVHRIPTSHSQAKSLIGKPVIGVGRLMEKTTAQIQHIYFRSKTSGRYVDVAIMRPDKGPLTKKGDSGLLWFTPTGKAFAVHAVGKRKSGATKAYVSLCMFAARIQRDLNVRLLEP